VVEGFQLTEVVTKEQFIWTD